MKLKPCRDDEGQIVGYAFYCPGCKHLHVYYVVGRIVWNFNGNMDLPTFSPSLLNHREGYRCHLNLTDGKIFFHADSTHELKETAVDLPMYEEAKVAS